MVISLYEAALVVRESRLRREAEERRRQEEERRRIARERRYDNEVDRVNALLCQAEDSAKFATMLPRRRKARTLVKIQLHGLNGPP